MAYVMDQMDRFDQFLKKLKGEIKRLLDMSD
jgi:hypothetical protein